MKSWLPLLASMLCASVAFADPPPGPLPEEARKAVSELIDEQLIAPMNKRAKRRSKFSRAAPLERARRVRVEETLLTDVRGQRFVRFAIDQRWLDDHEGKWQRDAFTGCVYPDARKIFVHSDEGYLPVRAMLGQEAEVQSDVCVPIPLGSAPREVPRS